MTFAKKIENSIVINDTLRKKAKFIKSKKRRIFGIILTAMIIIYLLVTNMIKFKGVDKSTFFDNDVTKDEMILYISFVAVILKILFSIINSFFKKSLFFLNHYKIYTLFDILSNIDLLVILAINIYNYVIIFNSYNIWDRQLPLAENLKALFSQNPFRLVLFFATIVINVPAIINFISYHLRYYVVFVASFFIAFGAPTFFMRFIRMDNDIFYQCAEYDDENIIVLTRKINIKNYNRNIALLKILLVIIVCGLVYITTYFIFPLLYPKVEEFYIFNLVAGWFMLYSINVIYFFRIITNRALTKTKRIANNNTVYQGNISGTFDEDDEHKENYENNETEETNEKIEYRFTDEEET